MAKSKESKEPKWYRKTNTKVVVVLPEEVVDYIESHSGILNIKPEEYVRRLVVIDILENQLKELRYSISD